MPEKDTTFLQWLIGGLFAFFAGWNLHTQKKVDDIKDTVQTGYVATPTCKEDRERMETAISEIKQIIERGFQGVHRRIDEALNKKD